MSLFPGLQDQRFQTSGAEIICVRGGAGAAVLLMHGYPQTHACWHRIAPKLACFYTAIYPDLRAFSDSLKLCKLSDHFNLLKRATTKDMVRVMASLGFAGFHLMSHDCDGRASHGC